MEERRNGSASGAGTSAVRASVPALSRNPATQPEVDKCLSLTDKQLRSLLIRALDTPALDLRPFLLLTPRQVSELIKAPEWLTLLDAMAGMAVLDKEDRWTKGQWRGLAYFRRTAAQDSERKKQRGKSITDDGSDAIDVEGMA